VGQAAWGRPDPLAHCSVLEGELRDEGERGDHERDHMQEYDSLRERLQQGLGECDPAVLGHLACGHKVWPPNGRMVVVGVVIRSFGLRGVFLSSSSKSSCDSVVFKRVPSPGRVGIARSPRKGLWQQVYLYLFG
jgi:hypothetical protein